MMTKHSGSTMASHPSPRSRTAPGSSLGLPATDLIKVTQKLKTGLPYQTLTRFEKHSGLALDTIIQVVQIPRRTLPRRMARGSLTPHESERLLRLALIFEKAVDLFEGDPAAARQWLQTPNKALAGESPLMMAETEIGAREVEDLMGRLEHGVFA